jgi:hypothetical protein
MVRLRWLCRQGLVLNSILMITVLLIVAMIGRWPRSRDEAFELAGLRAEWPRAQLCKVLLSALNAGLASA